MAATHKRLVRAVEQYLAFRRARYAESGVRQDEFVLRRFAVQMGDIQLRHLTAQRVAAWFYGANGLRTHHVTRDGVHRPPIQPSSHNYYRVRLACFFRFAQQRGWLRDDPLAEVGPLRSCAANVNSRLLRPYLACWRSPRIHATAPISPRRSTRA